MRNIRSREEWLTLFEQQQSSGLNKTQFCRQHGITRSAFSNARHRLSANNNPVTSFVPATPPNLGADKFASSDTLTENAPTLSVDVTPVTQAERQLALILPRATLSLPVDISPCWLATLLREMTP